MKPLTATKERKVVFNEIIANAASGAGIALMVTICGTGLLYLSHLLFARWLGAAEYGSYVYALNWAKVIALLAGLGLTTGVLRFIPEYLETSEFSKLRGIIKRSRQLTFLTGVIFAAIGTGLVIIIDPKVVNMTAVISGMWLVPLLGITALQGEMLVGAQKIFLARFPNFIAQPVLSIIIAFVIIASADTLNSLSALASYALAALFVICLQMIALNRVLPSKLNQKPALYSTSKWLRISIPLLLIQGFQLILLRGDIIIIGILRGDKEAGVYNAAAQTATFVSFVFAAVNTAIGPMIASLFTRGDRQSLQNLVKVASKWMFWPSCGITLVLILGGKAILSLFGGEFTAGWAALSILSISHMVRNSVGPSKYLLGLTEHQKISAGIFGVSALMNIILNFLLIPFWGPEGAALATFFTMIIWSIWIYIAVKKNLGIRSFVFSRT